MSVSSKKAPLIKNKKNHLVVTIGMAIGATLVLFFLSVGLNIDQTEKPSVQINKKAPAFKVQLIQQGALNLTNGSEFLTLENLKGKPLIINFWGSWCPSCRMEAKELEYFWQNKKNPNLILLGIAFQDSSADAKKFAKSFGKTYPLALDLESTAVDFGVTGAPETFIVNEKGVIVERIVGPVSSLKLLEVEKRYFKI